VTIRDLIKTLEAIAADRGHAVKVFCCDNADHDYVARHSPVAWVQTWTIEPFDPSSDMKEMRFAGAAEGETVVILEGES
jgi:hypothetical protein